MIDVTTKKPLRVEFEGNAPPFIDIATSQLDHVRELLDANDVPYWVDALAIAFEGEPEMTVINLSHRADPVAVQRLLDQAS
jgi:hypothetical protein